MSDTVITNYITAVTVDGDQVTVEISPTGPPGAGVPAGGATGQVLKKASSADFHTEWGDDTEGVQSVQGDGVDNTDPANPVISWPDPSDIGAYPDSNPDGFVDASGASNAAPVQSVNGQAGDVVLGAGDVGAIPASEKGAANGVATLGADGRVVYEQSIITPYEQDRGVGNTRFFGFDRPCQLTNLNLALVGNRLSGLPIWIPKPAVIDALIFNVESGAVGSSVEAYIYDRPILETSQSNRLHSFGSAATETNGRKEIVLGTPITLQRGWYIAAIQSVGGVHATVSALNNGAFRAPNEVAYATAAAMSDGLYGSFTIPASISTTWNQSGIGAAVLIRLRGTYL